MRPPYTICISNAVNPIRLNLPSQATVNAPAIEPAPENAIRWLYVLAPC
jgi:hypothetical protein